MFVVFKSGGIHWGAPIAVKPSRVCAVIGARPGGHTHLVLVGAVESIPVLETYEEACVLLEDYEEERTF